MLGNKRKFDSTATEADFAVNALIFHKTSGGITMIKRDNTILEIRRVSKYWQQTLDVPHLLRLFGFQLIDSAWRRPLTIANAAPLPDRFLFHFDNIDTTLRTEEQRRHDAIQDLITLKTDGAISMLKEVDLSNETTYFLIRRMPHHWMKTTEVPKIAKMFGFTFGMGVWYLNADASLPDSLASNFDDGTSIKEAEQREQETQRLKEMEEKEAESERQNQLEEAAKRLYGALDSGQVPSEADTEFVKGAWGENYWVKVFESVIQPQMARTHARSDASKEGLCDDTLAPLLARLVGVIGCGLRDLDNEYKTAGFDGGAKEGYSQKTIKIEKEFNTPLGKVRLFVRTQPKGEGRINWNAYFTGNEKSVRERMAVRGYKQDQVRDIATLLIALNAVWLANSEEQKEKLCPLVKEGSVVAL